MAEGMQLVMLLSFGCVLSAEDAGQCEPEPTWSCPPCSGAGDVVLEGCHSVLMSRRPGAPAAV